MLKRNHYQCGDTRTPSIAGMAPEHPKRLAEVARPIGEEHDPELTDDSIEGAIRKGQLLRIGRELADTPA